MRSTVASHPRSVIDQSRTTHSPSAARAGVQMLAEEALTAHTLVSEVPLLLAEDIFGSVFAAGMSIALAGVGTTIFAAFIVNGRYDEIERSMFEAQEEEAERAAAKQSGVSEDVKDYFGDINPQMSDEPKPKGTES